MATRLYLHRAAKSLGSGTLPSTEQSTLTQAGLLDALADNSDMNETISGVAQTSLAAAIAMTSSNKIVYVGRWVSDFLGVTSISANTWTLNFAAKCSSGLCYFPTDGSKKIFANIYIWRPSNGTKVGTMVADLASSNSNVELNTAERVVHVTFTGSAVTCQANDVIIVEIWTKPKSLISETPTHTFYYDGQTVTSSDNTGVSNHAAYLETPQNSMFVPPEITASTSNKDILKQMIVTNI